MVEYAIIERDLTESGNEMVEKSVLKDDFLWIFFNRCVVYERVIYIGDGENIGKVDTKARL